MKKATLSIAFLASLMILSAANAQLVGDQCTVDIVDVNIEYDTSAHVKMTYNFACQGNAENVGQLTKMLIKLPLGEVENVKASDSYGALDVLEGPAYVKTVSTADETSIGVMLRKGLIITLDEEKYALTVEFDAPTLVEEGEEEYILAPGVLAADPQTTIITEGITTTKIPVSMYNFKLGLYEASIKEVGPSVCEIKESDVVCGGLNKESFEELGIKWTQTGGPARKWSERIKDYTKKYIPTFGGTFKKIFGKLFGSSEEE